MCAIANRVKPHIPNRPAATDLRLIDLSRPQTKDLSAGGRKAHTLNPILQDRESYLTSVLALALSLTIAPATCLQQRSAALRNSLTGSSTNGPHQAVTPMATSLQSAQL